jgi:phosphatidylserine/phosphatidylglycerophosphate/cardiolipin synthase-like enzyme
MRVKGETEGGNDAVETRFAGPWLIPDGDYLSFVGRLFAGAGRRCLASLFLVSGAPWRDREFVMDGLLLALAEATWRGVDARLLVGGARSNAMMVQMAEAARKRARVLRVPCRWITSIPKVAGHSKVVIADDHVLVGSHNWSNAGLDGQTDSVCVTSGSLARMLDKRFRQQWQSAGEDSLLAV